MPVLVKIKHLKEFRFFRDFSWSEGKCETFNRYNIIYGWNGAGKTTLCDFFKSLEMQQACPAKSKVHLLIAPSPKELTTPVTHTNIGEISKYIKVFNQDYVHETVNSEDPIRHIYTVGSEQKHLLDKAKALRKEISDIEITEKKLKESKQQELNALESLKSTAAAEIRKFNALPQASYNKNHFWSFLEAFSCPSFYTDEEFERLLASTRTHKQDSIFPINFTPPIFAHLDVLADTLKTSPSGEAIEQLTKDQELRLWTDEGIKLHTARGSGTCLFCENPIPPSRLAALKGHFDDSYRKLTETLAAELEKVNSIISRFKSLKVNLPEKAVFYPELHDEYSLYKNAANAEFDSVILELENISKLILQKMSNLLDCSLDAELKIYKSNLEKISFCSIFNINSTINNHNAKTDSFNESITKAKKLIENAVITEKFDNILDIEDRAEKIERQLGEVLEKKKLLSESAVTIEQKAKNSQIPAKKMNLAIKAIFGRDEIQLKDAVSSSKCNTQSLGIGVF